MLPISAVCQWIVTRVLVQRNNFERVKRPNGAMIGKFIILALVALAHGMPRDGDASVNQRNMDIPIDNNIQDDNERREVADDRCPADQSHFLLPHEYDCTKFYYCEYGLRWVTPRDCPAGTEFSATIQVCIHPSLAGCDLPGSPTPPTPTTIPMTTEDPTTLIPTTTTITTEAPTTTTTTPEPTTTITTSEPTTTITTSEPTTTETTPEPTTTETTPEPTTTEITPEPTTTETTPEPTTTEITPEPTTTTTTPEPTTTTTTPEPTTTTTTTPEPITTTNGPCICPPTSTTTTTTEAPCVCPPETTTSVVTTEEPTTTITTTTTTTTPEPTTTTGPCICPPTSTTTTTTEAPCVCAPETTASVVTTEEPATTPVSITSTTSAPGCGGPVTLPNGCPSDFQVHQLLPHETNCSRFYYCLRGELVLRECPAGTHFNPKLQVCDWPENAGCEANAGDGCTCDDNNGGGDGDNGGDGGENGGGEGEDGGNGGEDGGNGGEDGGNGGEDGGNGGEDGGNGGEDGDDGSGNGDGGDENGFLPNGCPADFDIHKLIPHECDCSKFFYCHRGEKVERDCPAGLHFNPVLEVCDWPENAGCESGSGGGGEGGGDVTTSRCATGCNVLPWEHETDCDKFWRCDGDKEVLTVCSEGLHFNAQTYTCDFICYANCDRSHVQATSYYSGLKLFIPWDRVDHNVVGHYIGQIGH